MTEKWVTDTKKMVDVAYNAVYERRGMKPPWVPKDVLLPLPNPASCGVSIYSPDKRKSKKARLNG